MNIYYSQTETNKAQQTKEGMEKFFNTFLKSTTYANRQFFQNCRKYELIPRLFIIDNKVYEWLDTKTLLNSSSESFCIYCGHHVTLTSNGKIVHGVQNSKCMSITEGSTTIKTNTSAKIPQAEISDTNKMTTLNRKRLNKLMKKAKEEAKRQQKVIDEAVQVQLNIAKRNTQ